MKFLICRQAIPIKRTSPRKKKKKRAKEAVRRERKGEERRTKRRERKGEEKIVVVRAEKESCSQPRLLRRPARKRRLRPSRKKRSPGYSLPLARESVDRKRLVFEDRKRLVITGHSSLKTVRVRVWKIESAAIQIENLYFLFQIMHRYQPTAGRVRDNQANAIVLVLNSLNRDSDNSIDIFVGQHYNTFTYKSNLSRGFCWAGNALL